MTFTREMISPEFAAMLRKVNRPDKLDGFDVQDSDLEWYRAEAEKDHPEKTPAEREAWAAFASLFDPTAAHNVKDPGGVVSPTDAATALQKSVAGLFASQERRDTVRAEIAQKNLANSTEQMLGGIRFASGAIGAALVDQSNVMRSVENTIDEHRQSVTTALNDATERLERAVIASASAASQQASQAHADRVDYLQWVKYSIVPQIVIALSLAALAAREILR